MTYSGYGDTSEGHIFKRETREAFKRQALKHRKETIARWRAANPEATCSDSCAFAIAVLQLSVGRL